MNNLSNELTYISHSISKMQAAYRDILYVNKKISEIEWENSCTKVESVSFKSLHLIPTPFIFDDMFKKS